ncbi:MAG: methylenetetrahydrofolate reductase C-terminal domain-containing protein [Thermoleophilia bacterium]|nr:methylenetetrahydrofolate reductase C-terminal domain-containing protein [Thermoleophilia bacterium]
MALRELLADRDRFVIAAELVTSRGLITAEAGRRVLGLARDLAAHPRIDVVSITDNPGGNPMLAPDTVASELAGLGQEAIVHVSCKDLNRSALQSRGWKLASEGLRNVLCLTGDYPIAGYRGQARPVFDIDSVGLLRLYTELNAELADEERLCLGAVVTNHKRHEREVVPQYLKLRRKLEHGAEFVINQVGYHARKDDELLRWLARAGLDVPVLANVFVLSPGAARVFHSGRIPGVVVTDELLAVCGRYANAADKGRPFFRELAAKQVAIARGLGFRGAYIGGHLAIEDYDSILALADSFAPGDWRAFARELQYPYPDEFHFFERDEETGLASDRVDAAYLESLAPARRRRLRLRVSPLYKLNRRVHDLAFEPGAPLAGPGRAFYGAVERGPRPVGRALHGAEYLTKQALFSCRDCGDCSLPEIAYLCPESQCVKNQRNGPCGGTRQGLCEIGEKECIWARAYERLKAYGKEETMLDGPAVLKDGSLQGTSAWANTFLGRDHHAREREEA